MDINCSLATVTNVSVTQGLISATLISLVCFIIVYKWKYRHLEKLAAQLPGPPTLPKLGNAMTFLGSSEDGLQSVVKLARQYDCLFRIWIGQYLIITIYKPEDIQIVLNSPKTFNKGFAYRYIGLCLGNGLITAPADIWDRHRRVMAPNFNTKMLKQYIPLFSKYNKKLVDKLRLQVNSGQFDIWKYITFTNLDIVCETTCGVSDRTHKEKYDFAEALHRVVTYFLLGSSSLGYTLTLFLI